MNIEEQRKLFEAHIRSAYKDHHPFQLMRTSSDCYAATVIQLHWETWQACANQRAKDVDFTQLAVERAAYEHGWRTAMEEIGNKVLPDPIADNEMFKVPRVLTGFEAKAWQDGWNAYRAAVRILIKLENHRDT